MRVLLCEDEKMLSDAVKVILEHHKFCVDCAYDGEQALYGANNGNYDIVLLDIMMPKLDGLSVLKKLRESGNSIPIIMLTAMVQTEDIVTGLDSGASDYICKPFKTEELIARIRALLRRYGGVSSSTDIDCLGMTLSQSDYSISFNGKKESLSNKEYQVLELLALSPKRLFSSEILMEKVWGYDSDSSINVVWVCISSLRKKIASIGSSVRIEAVRNIGYGLKEK